MVDLVYHHFRIFFPSQLPFGGLSDYPRHVPFQPSQDGVVMILSQADGPVGPGRGCIFVHAAVPGRMLMACPSI